MYFVVISIGKIIIRFKWFFLGKRNDGTIERRGNETSKKWNNSTEHPNSMFVFNNKDAIFV